MAHLTSRGDPCCYKDGHTWQHRANRATGDRKWNQEHGAEAAARYRNRNPVARALTIVKHNAKHRAGV